MLKPFDDIQRMILTVPPPAAFEIPGDHLEALALIPCPSPTNAAEIPFAAQNPRPTVTEPYVCPWFWIIGWI